MRVRLTSRAASDLAKALDWYDANAPHVKARFLDQYDALTERLAENPRQFPRARGEARRAGFDDFPYGLFYRIKADEVEVFACLHAKRHPAHWQRRAQ
jgi:toxin ParE1/3/4